MAYVEPNTDILLLHNCPLDNTYEHTILFTDKTDQYNYFRGLAKKTFSSYSYQRVNSGVMRVAALSDDIYDCNYLMFRNTNFGNKWFYAFVTSVEYVNNTTSEIQYEIDVMQTWHFDYNLGECFVEREHSSTDSIGENINPEPLSTGEYVVNGTYGKLWDELDNTCAIVAIVDTTEESQAKRYDGVISGADLWAYSNDSVGIQALKAKLNEYLQAPDKVIGIYLVPRYFVTGQPSGPAGGEIHIPEYSRAEQVRRIRPLITTDDTLDGYKPKNKKLYTYPFNFYHIDNASGSELTLRYEFFHNNQPVIVITGTYMQPVELIARPYGYKNSGQQTLNTESIKLGNYPMCGWAVDSYQAWVAQNSIPTAINFGKTIAGGLASGGIVGAAVGAAGQIANLISNSYSASISADISKGAQTNGNANVSSGMQNFFDCRMSVTAQTAKIIDDYFSRYGYATNRTKIPNRSARPVWNYVKTVKCSATGSIPASAMSKICSIYDSGVTFWKNGNKIGDYSFDNSPEEV